MPPYAIRRSRRRGVAGRFCHGARNKRDRMVPAPATIRSIWTRDTRCLISPCKIPANLPYHPRRGAPRGPRRKTPESSHTLARRYVGGRPVMPVWRSMAYGAQRYRSRGALREKPGQREPVTCLAYPRPASMSTQPRVTPFVGQQVGQVADAMSEAKSIRSASRYAGECRMCYQLLALWFGSDKIDVSSVQESRAIRESERHHRSRRISCQ
jgi:hypothetical protein